MYRSPAYERHISKHLVAASQPSIRPDSWCGQQFDTVYVGLSGLTDGFEARVAIAISNAAYLIDYLEYGFKAQDFPVPSSMICDSIITELERYSRTYLEKIVGVAFPKEFCDKVPSLCSRLWTELDCTPLVLDHHQRPRQPSDQGHVATFRGWKEKPLDEQADSMVRKCIRSFGARNIPHLNVGPNGLVEADGAFYIHLASVEDFKNSVVPETWSLAQRYAMDLQQRGVKIAVFGAIPQSRAILSTGVSLLGLLRCLGVDIRWYTPDPSPRVSPIVWKVQKMLQGSFSSEVELTTDEKLQVLNWVHRNAEHHWVCNNGPLRQPQDGGAHVVIIEDASLSALALISKQHDPKRPVIFHSQTDVRVNSPASTDSPQSQAFDFIWSTLKHTDVLACQKQKGLESPLIPRRKVGYLLASVDRFDGLNKDMTDWDYSFYGRQFNASGRASQTATIKYPDDQYIFVQMSNTPRFQHARAALEAYREYYRILKVATPALRIPKLCICDFGAHSHEEFHDAVASHVALHMTDLANKICVKQVGPPDQMWNTLVSKAEAIVLLPEGEDFEERFLQAVQKDKPIIRTRPLGPYYSLVQNNENVYTIGAADTQAMTECLLQIRVEWGKHQQKGIPMPNKTWDEVTTVGNAVSWLFLASSLSKGETVEPQDEQIYRLAQRSKDTEMYV